MMCIMQHRRRRTNMLLGLADDCRGENEMKDFNVGSWQCLLLGGIEAIVLGKELAKAGRAKAIGGLAVMTMLVAVGLALLFSRSIMLPFWVILALLVAIWVGYFAGTRGSKSSPQSQEAEDAFA